MYGIVNRAVMEFVCLHHGEAVWEQIRERAGVSEEVFLSNEGYPDAMTYNLVAAAAELLNAPAEEILEAFGEHWMLKTAVDNYEQMLDAGGSSFPEFLLNLSNFHTRVQMIFPKLLPPRFETTDVGPNSLNLHYYSSRDGLQPFLIGILRGLSKRFETEIEVRHLEKKCEGADHDIYTVSWTNCG